MYEDNQPQMSSEVTFVHTDEAPVMRAWPPVSDSNKIKIRGIADL